MPMDFRRIRSVVPAVAERAAALERECGDDAELRLNAWLCDHRIKPGKALYLRCRAT
jgi:hypothetical protein